MKDFLLSLLAVSVSGTLIAAVFPDGEMKRPLLFLSGTVTAVAFFVLFSQLSGGLPRFPDYPSLDYTADFERFVSDAATEAVSEEKHLIPGSDTKRDVTITYADGVFFTEGLSEDESNPAGMIPDGGEYYE